MRVATMIVLLWAFTVTGCAQTESAVRIKIVAQWQTPGRAADHGNESETVIYASHGRIRTEMSSSLFPSMVTIQLCDKQTMLVLDASKREYSESPLSGPGEAKADGASADRKDEAPPNLLVETTTVDTGETKSAFGHTAHRYIITTTMKPAPELEQQPNETVVDAWYLDIPELTTCQPRTPRRRGLIWGYGGRGPQVTPRPEFKYSGPEPQGLILSQTSTTKSSHVLATGEEKADVQVSSMEIVEMAETPVHHDLFEAPAGFTKVKQLRSH